MTEREKMLAGELYDPTDPELAEARRKCRERCLQFNQLGPDRNEERQQVLEALLGSPTDASLQPTFFCDYGTNIHLGKGVFFNFNCVILDVAPVHIGDFVLFGPAVQIYTATHPMDAAERRSGLESGKPVCIGNDVWIGGGAIICPGVTIGERAVIGAGSVVVKDVAPDTVVAGNPARVLRTLCD